MDSHETSVASHPYENPPGTSSGGARSRSASQPEVDPLRFFTRSMTAEASCSAATATSSSMPPVIHVDHVSAESTAAPTPPPPMTPQALLPHLGPTPEEAAALLSGAVPMICDVPVPDDIDGYMTGHEMSSLFAWTEEDPSFSGNLGTGLDAGASLRGCSPSSVTTAAIFAPSANGLAKDNEGLPPVASMTKEQLAHEVELLRCQNQQSFFCSERSLGVSQCIT